MAISDVCKFEFKSNVDRVQREQGISRKEAIAQLAYELGVLEETARKKDYRARKELGQNVPQNSSSSKKIDTYIPPSGHGGKRNGAGRPQKIVFLVN